MKKRLLLTVSFTVFLMLILLSGCSGGENLEESQEINIIIPYPVTVQGNEFESAPEKIASLSPVMTKLIFDFGYGDKIIAVTENESDKIDTAGLPEIGTAAFPDIDKIIELSPDVLILNNSLPKADMDRLYLKNIKTLVFEMPKTPDELRLIYMNLGVIFTGAASNKSIERDIPRDGKFLEEYQKIKDAYDDILSKTENNKKTYMWIKSADGSVLTGDTPQSSLLGYIAENIAENSRMYSADLSEMAEKNPSHIFIEAPLSAEEISENELWGEFESAGAGNITQIEPDTLRYIYSEDIISSLYVFAKALYPENIDG